MTKKFLKRLILAFSLMIKPAFILKNRLMARRGWVLVLGGRSYARELVQQLHLLGYKVYLFDAAPKSINWRFAAGTRVLDVYDPKNIALMVSTAKHLGCGAALMQSDDELLPIIAEVNQKLGNSARFSDTAVRASLDKAIMRRHFAEAGMELPKWVKASDRYPPPDVQFPYIIKPLNGQGSKGVAYVADMVGFTKAISFIKDEMKQNQYLIEEYLPGRQFNVDGVIFNGEPFIHMISEEEFGDFAPAFKPCWYLFGITLTDAMRAEIYRESRAALGAVDFHSGAFHLELKFRGDKAFAFDMANRMPADFPKYGRLVHGVSLVENYLEVMQGNPVTQPSMDIRCAHLRYYNYPERPDNARIDALAQALANSDVIRLRRDGFLLEMTADHEQILRDFLGDVYAVRDHN